MRKITAFLLCFCLLSIGSVTAFAQTVSQDGTGGDSIISVTVPDSHILTVSAEHARVFYDGQWGKNFSVERLSSPQLLIRPENGYRVTRVTLNGEDVTEQVQGGYYTLEPVYEDKRLVVETEQVPVSTDSTHDISGTVIDGNGDPIPGGTVEIGGKTGTIDEDGYFTVEDVPDGYLPVTVTDGDGNIIGYTEIEIEIGGGETGVSASPGSSYIVTVSEGSGLRLDLTVTVDGRITVAHAAEVSPPRSDDMENSQTDDESNILLWVIIMFVSGIGVIGITFFNKKRRCGAK